jgi:hypothetical protein
MTDAYFSEDDIYSRRSPGLEQVYVKAAPSPPPAPAVTKVFHPPVSSPSSRRQKKANRRKSRPTQGDWVLIREMAPNQPDIARQVSQQTLDCDTDPSESGRDDEDEMEDLSPSTAVPSADSAATHVVHSGAQPSTLQHPKDVFTKPGQPTATSAHRDSVVEADVRSGTFGLDRRASEVSSVSSQPSIHPIANDAKPNNSGGVFSLPSKSTTNLPSQRKDSTATPHPQDELSTSLHQLQIPQSNNRLPIIQSHSPSHDATSPNTQQLPSISHMVGDIPRSASVSEEVRPTGLAHRQSISSIAQSPTSRPRQMSMSSHTPASPFPPLSASSPMSASSDVFLRSGSSHFLVGGPRRPSHASETGRVPPSASTSEGYQSSDGPSPGSQPSPVENRQRHMSLDGTLASAIILPVPNGSGIQQVGSHVVGAFRCKYPGCNALPFQTQYLLK